MNNSVFIGKPHVSLLPATKPALISNQTSLTVAKCSVSVRVVRRRRREVAAASHRWQHDRPGMWRHLAGLAVLGWCNAPGGVRCQTLPKTAGVSASVLVQLMYCLERKHFYKNLRLVRVNICILRYPCLVDRIGNKWFINMLHSIDT